MPPEVVLLLFLPGLLFWESLTTSKNAIRRDLRGILITSTVFVVATAFAVAWIASSLGIPWEAALILGAAVAPPDATAAAPVPAAPVMQPQAAAPAPQQAAPQTQAQGDIAKALYDNGVQSFNARNYKQALKSFSDFTDTYGKHKLVSNAWFWRGECNYQLGNFPAAAMDYEQVISKYGSSGKAASA